MDNEKIYTEEKITAIVDEEIRKANPGTGRELSAGELESVSGGSLIPGGTVYTVDDCKHSHKYKTGKEREDSRFFLWSQHQFQYHCLDCDKDIWIDEEP